MSADDVNDELEQLHDDAQHAVEVHVCARLEFAPTCDNPTCSKDATWTSSCRNCHRSKLLCSHHLAVAAREYAELVMIHGHVDCFTCHARSTSLTAGWIVATLIPGGTL